MGGSILRAVEEFRTAESIDALWASLGRHLSAFGITGILYGTEAMPGLPRDSNFILNSLDAGWLAEKFANDLFHCDEYVRVARVDPTPVLWAAPETLPDITPEARRSLGLDYDYGIITGATVPMRFCDGLGGSSIGCHAANMSFAEFAGIWGQGGTDFAMIVNAFDATLRQRFGMEMFGLTVEERSCLSYLAIGLRAKQISARMRRTDRQVYHILKRARARLKSHTVEQAVATALVYGLITP
jgi:DNA-binding CsgD family transcriptional regulator